jgi:hypothetical protein
MTAERSEDGSWEFQERKFLGMWRGSGNLEVVNTVN